MSVRDQRRHSIDRLNTPPNSDIGRVTNRFFSPRLGRRQPELGATTRQNPGPGIHRGVLFFVRCMEATLRL
jgi:hypothetical protein